MEANLIRDSRTAWSIISTFTLLLIAPALNAQILERSPYSGGVLAARAVRAGRIQFHSGNNLPTSRDLTCSPAPCVFPNVQASGGGQPSNENPIAANPSNPNQLLSGGNDFNCPNIQGFYASNDGGSTWLRRCLSGSGGQGDPIVGYDLNNVAYAGGIQNSSIVLSSSTDNGDHWSSPTVVVGPLLGALADKPWLEVDTNPNSPFANALYVSVTQFAGNNDSQISVSHSNDGGMTWVSRLVGSRETFPNGVAQFSDLAVAADGTVYVTWQRCKANGPTGDCGGTTARMVTSKSTDGGDTWSTPVTITSANLLPDSCFCAFYGSLPNTSERVANIPAIAVDTSTRPTGGNLYVVFYNWTGSQMQVKVTTSTDDGATWSTGVNVSASTSGDQFFPWINLAANGRIAVTWLDRRNDPANLRYQPFFAISTNAGASFSVNRPLSSTPSNPNNDGFGGTFMGDYRGHVWVGKAIYTSWMDMRSGVSQDEIGGVQF